MMLLTGNTQYFGLTPADAFNPKTGLFMGPNGQHIADTGGRGKAPETKIRESISGCQPDGFGGDPFFPVCFAPNPDQDVGNPMPGADRAELYVSNVAAPVIGDDGEQTQGLTGGLRALGFSAVGGLGIPFPMEVRLADV